jgi:hypothetical protein
MREGVGQVVALMAALLPLVPAIESKLGPFNFPASRPVERGGQVGSGSNYIFLGLRKNPLLHLLKGLSHEIKWCFDDSIVHSQELFYTYAEGFKILRLSFSI